MRILIYTNSFAPEIGGAETYVMLLAHGLATQAPANEHQVRVVTRTPCYTSSDAALPFSVVRQPTLGRLFHLIRDSDVVHVAGPCISPLTLSLALGKPTVVEHHGYQAICPNGLLFQEPGKTLCPGHFMSHHYLKCVACHSANHSWFSNLANVLATFPRRWACRLATLNLPITDHVKQRLNLPRSNVVYYGIPDPMQKSPVMDLETAGEGPHRMTNFAFVGRLVSEKGLPLLVHAAQQLWAEGHRFRLKFVGDGPERERTEDLATTLGLGECVEFTGYLHGEALKKTMGTIDALVMPSIWEETAGLSAIEQMMSGRLVIAADIGGLAEVVGDEGLKFAPGDLKGLESCMRRVLLEPGLVQALGEKARQRALELYLQERMVAEHLKAYRQLLGGARSSSERHGAVA